MGSNKQLNTIIMTPLFPSSPPASCGACKFLRRKCSTDCIFAPYFSYENAAAHFAAVHKVFGASNASKLLSHLPIHSRREAAATVSYEALARVNDPIYGCVAHIIMLQQQVASLQEEIHSLLVNQMDTRRNVAAIENIWCSESAQLNNYHHLDLHHDDHELLQAVSTQPSNSLAYNNDNHNNHSHALLIDQQNPLEAQRNASADDAIIFGSDKLSNIDFMWETDDTMEIQNQLECLLGLMEEEESFARSLWIDHNVSAINNLGF